MGWVSDCDHFNWLNSLELGQQLQQCNASGAGTGLCLCQHLQCLIGQCQEYKSSQDTRCALRLEITQSLLRMSLQYAFVSATILDHNCHSLSRVTRVCHAAGGGGGGSGFPWAEQSGQVSSWSDPLS